MKPVKCMRKIFLFIIKRIRQIFKLMKHITHDNTNIVLTHFIFSTDLSIYNVL